MQQTIFINDPQFNILFCVSWMNNLYAYFQEQGHNGIDGIDGIIEKIMNQKAEKVWGHTN